MAHRLGCKPDGQRQQERVFHALRVEDVSLIEFSDGLLGREFERHAQIGTGHSIIESPTI